MLRTCQNLMRNPQILPEEQAELQDFVEQLRNKPVMFTLSRALEINNTMIMRFVSAICIYFIIDVQFVHLEIQK